MRSPRISEGKCAAYGKEQPDAFAVMSMWRSRLHNEQAGFTRSDMSGANASISLVWTGSATEAERAKQRYSLASYRKRSELKQRFDFGTENIANHNARVQQRQAQAPPPSPRMALSAAPAPVASARLGLGDTLVSPRASPRSFLETEPQRLDASAKLRDIGQSFLRAGNLAQAKLYLEKAEKLLNVSPRYLRANEADQLMDDFRSQKDPFN